jgi:hypothetical protein
MLAVVFGALFTAGVATAAPAPVHSAVHAPVVHSQVAAASPTTPKPPPASSTTPTTDFNKGQQAADAALARRKLMMGIACVVLLVIVYFGHRAKYKHILRVKNLQNAKS